MSGPPDEVEHLNFPSYYANLVESAQLGHKLKRDEAFAVRFMCYDCKRQLTLKISAADIALHNLNKTFYKPVNWTTFTRKEAVVMAAGATYPMLQCDVCNGLKAKAKTFGIVARARSMTKAQIVQELQMMLQTCFHKDDSY